MEWVKIIKIIWFNFSFAQKTMSIVNKLIFIMESLVEDVIRRFRGNAFILGIMVMGVVVTGIVTFVIQAIVFILVRPWSLKMYRKISYYFSAIMYWRKFSR